MHSWQQQLQLSKGCAGLLWLWWLLLKLQVGLQVGPGGTKGCCVLVQVLQLRLLLQQGVVSSSRFVVCVAGCWHTSNRDDSCGGSVSVLVWAGAQVEQHGVCICICVPALLLLLLLSVCCWEKVRQRG
jgi:hypothetical protein